MFIQCTITSAERASPNISSGWHKRTIMTRLFFSAGEASGDVHGGNLIRALREIEPGIECEGLGGQQMAAAGMRLRCNLAGRAIMGITDVVKSLGFIRKVFHESVERLRETKPDALVLIDYPSFNMRLGKRAKALGIPVVYYISPKVWVWKKWRVNTLARFVDKMLVIFPFEKKIYDAAGLGCAFVGNPLLDDIRATQIEGVFADASRPVVGILPGSREEEIRRIMPVMLEVARGMHAAHAQARFVAPCVDAAREAQVKAIVGDFPIETTIGQTHEVLHAARFCLVTSGTATLETALFKVPLVVLYVASPLMAAAARRVIQVKWISLVNILSGKEVVPEFIQADATADKILPVALQLFEDSDARKSMLRDLTDLCDSMGSEGASNAAARETMAVVKGKPDG